jgi:Putative zinc-finger
MTSNKADANQTKQSEQASYSLKVKMMNCETLQLNLSLYFDDILTSDELSTLDAHLKTCPLCRVKLSEIKSLTNDLRAFSNIEVPSELSASIRSKVANELRNQPRKVFISNNLVELLQFRVMPYAVGTVASLLLFLAFLGSFPNIQSTAGNYDITTKEIAFVNTLEDVRKMEMPNKFGVSNEIPLTSAQYASSRSDFSKESPSLNPSGALIALANTFARDNVREDEVVLVADVYGNGLAKISQVVEAPKNKLSMEKIENALQNDADYAPFVPSNLDNRSDNMQIVFKIQTVEVNEKRSKPKHR